MWDPVFNSILKQKFQCVASEEFGENGKYPVNRLKTVMLALQVVGCGLGDVWQKSDSRVQPPRANDNLEWFADFVQKQLDMPLVLKGIMHPDDARKAVRSGVDGIIVSNHGGRQVDGSISTIEALPGTAATYFLEELTLQF